ncbi:glycosyltransferase family 4 protein [Pelagerythrobacter rhizovicinus]|nr:glycosyltransferase family 4 protein [Pelagerythrobacter rhizovicinus]
MTRHSTPHVLMTADAVGGVWQYATDLVRALSDHGAHVTLAVMGPSPSVEQRRKVEGVAGVDLLDTGLPLDWLTRSPEPVRCAARKLAELAREIGADVVHCNSPILAGAARFPVPVVAVAHGCITTWWETVRGDELDPALTWHRDLTRKGLLSAEVTVAPSAAFAEILRETYELPRTPRAIHNGRYPLPPTGRGSGEHLFALTVGRLWDEGKNMAVLDRAAASAATPMLAAGASESPSGKRIPLHHLQLCGKLDEHELATLLAKRPIFASAAIFEPFGLAVLEAAMAGCPLVLSDIPTFRELWGGAAIFISHADAEGFADAIDRLAEDRGERARLGEAARERAARYTPQASAAATAALYGSLLEQGRAA